LLAALGVCPIYGIDVVVNAIPGSAQFVNYGVIDWKGATITSDALHDVSVAVSSATEQIKGVASKAGADLIVLIAPEHGVLVSQSVTSDEFRMRKEDPVLVAVFYKMGLGRGPTTEDRSVHFTTVALKKAAAESVKMKIEQVKDTAGVTLSYWVYLNLPRFIAEAVAKGFDTVTIESSKDADCEEVWLPGCDVPLRISKEKPVIQCSIYKSREANQVPEPTAASSRGSS